MPTDLSIGGIGLVGAEDRRRRFSGLVWGKSGCGKTILATTLPGKRLWISFDPDGTDSFDATTDDIILDMAAVDPSAVERWEEGKIIEKDLDALLRSRADIQSVIFDSVTSFGQLALAYAITSGKGDGKNFKASMAAPGISGYGVRNRVVLNAIRMILKLVARHHKHSLLICHEAPPEKNTEGNITGITILLGGDMPETVPLNISEVWYMADDGKKRTLALRPYAMRSPMRSRMFDTQSDRTIFDFKYDARTRSGDGIKEWFQQWEAGDFKKLAVPK